MQYATCYAVLCQAPVLSSLITSCQVRQAHIDVLHAAYAQHPVRSGKHMKTSYMQCLPVRRYVQVCLYVSNEGLAYDHVIWAGVVVQLLMPLLHHATLHAELHSSCVYLTGC